MEMYLHDSSAALRFVLRGELAGGYVRELEHAWTTANSILGARELVVDVSGMTNADTGGRELLSRMRQSGARMRAVAGPRDASIWRTLRDAICATSPALARHATWRRRPRG